MLVTSAPNNTVTPIATSTNQPGTPISVNAPAEPAVAPDGGTAYALTAGTTITPIDLFTKTAGSPIALAHPAQAIEITPDGALAVISETTGTNSFVQVVDLTSGTPEAPVAMSNQPAGDLAIARDGRTAYVVAQTFYEAGLPSKFGADYPFTIAERTVGERLAGQGTWYFASKLVEGAGGRLFGVVTCVGWGGTCPYGFVFDSYPSAPERSATLFNGSEGQPSSPATMALAPSPAASFTITPGTTDRPTAFDAVASNNDGGSITSFTWDFGDGATQSVNTASASHVYRAPGSYRVRLTTTNAGGCAARLVFTGQTPTCTGSPTAVTTRKVTVITPGATATTAQAGARTTTSATLNGTVGETGGQVQWHFEYGTSARYGKTTPAVRGTGKVADTVSKLKPDTTYHYRLVAATEQGTPPVSTGGDVTFKTVATGTLRLRAKTLRLRGKSVNVALRCASSVACRGKIKLTSGKRTCATGAFRLRANQRAHKRLTVRSTCRSKRSARLTSTSSTGQKNITTTVRIKR